MTEDQYKKIAQVCDEILLAQDANLTTIAIPWLHVLNEHPQNQIKYTKLFEPGYSNFKKWKLHFLLESVKSVLGVLRSGRIKQKISGKRSVIIISHLLNQSQVGNPTDFYFGDLPSELVKSENPGLLLLLNHTDLPSVGLDEKWDSSGGERAIFPGNLGFIREVLIRVSMFREAWRLFRKGNRETDRFKRDVIIKAATEAVSSSSVHSLRMYHYISELVKKTGAGSIAVTFEGHSWERVAFAGARRANPAVTCIGYHHTIIFPRQHAALRSLPRPYQPDIIFTAGDYARDYFRRAYHDYVSVTTLGMHRLRKEDIPEQTNFIEKSPVCLVIPDGIISEVLYIFRFVMESALKEPRVCFLLRLHPAIPKESFLTEYPEFNNLPENVVFSKDELQADFTQSKWALYRGSNAAIYATIAGLKPIYLARENELAIDCLFEFKTWKKTVLEVNDLLAVVRADLEQNDKDAYYAESIEAVREAKKYFMPVDSDVFLHSVIKEKSRVD